MERRHIALVGTGALLALVTVAALTVGLGTAGADPGVESSLERSISVSASGEAATAPDKAVVRVAATASGEDAATVRDQLADESEALRNELDALGVDYETSSYAIDEPDRHRKREAAPSGYVGEHEFTVTLQDPDATGDVIDAAADSNASVDGVTLTLTDATKEQLREQAIQRAMDDARQQADTIAASGDLSVVGVASVDASQRHYRPVAYDGAATAESAETTIDRGDVSVSYHVEVTYNATGA